MHIDLSTPLYRLIATSFVHTEVGAREDRSGEHGIGAYRYIPGGDSGLGGNGSDTSRRGGIPVGACFVDESVRRDVVLELGMNDDGVDDDTVAVTHTSFL